MYGLRLRSEAELMKIIAHNVTGKDLVEGDLFSVKDQFYWDHYDPRSVGQQVYIRTSAPCPPDELDVVVYRIEIR